MLQLVSAAGLGDYFCTVNEIYLRMKYEKIGLELGKVRLADFSTEWTDSFNEQKRILQEIFKGEEIWVEHIGSTAIAILKAKPIIDILLVISDAYEFNLQDAFDKLQSIGFVKGEFEREEGIFFQKGEGNFHTHYLHLYFKKQNWIEFIQFRDYLKQNPEEAALYQALKMELEEKYPSDRQLYTASKNHFIESILLQIENKPVLIS